MHKRLFPLFLLLTLTLIPIVYSVLTIILNVSPYNVELEVWKGFNNDGEGNASFVDGKFNLSISDPTGGWALAKICRGIMPHGWGLRYALLDNEIEIEKGDSADVLLDIDLKLINYENYTVSNSSMNVAIVLFFDGYITDYQEHCYQTEIQFFSYYGDRVQRGQTWFFMWRNDSVAQFKLADNLQVGEYKHYSINLAPYIKTMMAQYGLNHAKLKHVEIFTEAYRGYCNFEVYSAKITYTPKSNNCNLLFAFLVLILLFVCIIIFKACITRTSISGRAPSSPANPQLSCSKIKHVQTG